MKKQMWWGGVALIVSINLTSCATMSPEECQAADWRVVGQSDGQRGYLASRLSSHSETCNKVGVNVNEKEFLQGYEIGLKMYCRLENAVGEGLSGGIYLGVCNEAFQMRFQIAHNVHDLRNDVHYLDASIEALERKLRETTSENERQSMRKKLEEYGHELRHKREELRWAEYALNNLH